MCISVQLLPVHPSLRSLTAFSGLFASPSHLACALKFCRRALSLCLTEICVCVYWRDASALAPPAVRRPPPSAARSLAELSALCSLLSVAACTQRPIGHSRRSLLTFPPVRHLARVRSRCLVTTFELPLEQASSIVTLHRQTLAGSLAQARANLGTFLGHEQDKFLRNEQGRALASYLGTSKAAPWQVPWVRVRRYLGGFLSHEQGHALARARPRLGTGKTYIGKGLQILTWALTKSKYAWSHFLIFPIGAEETA
ncbi:hypothetical protein Scep_022498 [Stephania cephalantha]|uniref:Uncharacterized protein n=1 Tax=Stephania cephalantha TaxID=152367 RepID=A0AAP0FHS8_9MAGN